MLKSLWKQVADKFSRTGRKPRIGLALGSGGVWGVAHVGVLSFLEEKGIPVDFLSGSSAGAFVGALYAGGIRGRDLEASGRDYRWRNAGRISYPPKMGLATNERMGEYLKSKIGNPNFEDLKVPFYVVATNLNAGTLRVFNSGPVIPAVRASCAIPGIFAPVRLDGEWYCDGGLLNPLPCGVLREAGADFVIGVGLGPHKRWEHPKNIFSVVLRAMDVSVMNNTRPEAREADLMILPDLGGLDEFAFDQNDALIEQGRAAAERELSGWNGVIPGSGREVSG